MSTDIMEETTGQITQEVNRQRNQAKELQEVFTKLNAKLSDMMKEPSVGASASPERPTFVPLAATIADSNDTIGQCIQDFDELLERLEI